MEKHYKEFFEDLEKPKKRSFFRGCTWVIGILIILLVLSFTWLFFLATREVNPAFKVEYSQETYDRFMGDLLSLENIEKPAKLTIDSQTLTSFLIKALEDNQQNLSAIQGRIHSDSLELFARTDRPIRTSLSLTILPRLEGDQLKLDLSQAQVGQLKLPPFAVQALNRFFLSNLTGVVEDNISLSINKMTLKENKAIFNLSPLKEKKPVESNLLP